MSDTIIVKSENAEGATFFWDKEAYEKERAERAERDRAFHALYNSDYFVELTRRAKPKGTRRLPRARNE